MKTRIEALPPKAEVNYTQGALRYLFQTTQPSWAINDSGNSAGFAPITDTVYGGSITGTGLSAATSLNLTSAWNVNAAHEHFWSPRWRTSLYGGYAKVENGGQAQSQGCTFSSTTGLVIAGCNGDWSTWWIGSRTQWNVTKDFYMGLDVMYSKLDSATALNGTYRSVPVGSASPSQYRRTSEHYRRPIRTTGRSGSACTATSIPDRVIMGV